MSQILPGVLKDNQQLVLTITFEERVKNDADVFQLPLDVTRDSLESESARRVRGGGMVI